MSRPRVVHCKREAYDVYVGRPSKWGNPYAIGTDGTREEVVQKFAAMLEHRPDLVSMAKAELKEKVLGCWCKTKKDPDALCHGDVLLAVANMCDCECHDPGKNILHCMPCCQMTYEKRR